MSMSAKSNTLDYPMRLHVFLQKAGVGSRRACEAFIEEGKVEVNGTLVTAQGVQVDRGDEVRFEGRPVHPSLESVYLAVNKPPKYLCSNRDPEGRPLVIDLVAGDFSERLFTVGRLDFLSSGLIFLTNDGDFANAVMHPSKQVEKEYFVETKKPIPEDLLKRYKRGFQLEGETYRLKSYRLRSPRRAYLTLLEGKNREIRRVFQAQKVTLRRLQRVRIGPVKLHKLPEGSYRQLSKQEISWFLGNGKGGKS
jgi:23S rRNA pseudouridine2605 synthase